MSINFDSTAYGWLMLSGIIFSVMVWWRLARGEDPLVMIYIAALAGAFLGAKVAYLVAEGWMRWEDENLWLQLATGKSITGGLLGGYAAVEIAKRLLGHRTATGDWFAIVAPVGILFGRLGCVAHGCCLGKKCEASWFTVADAEGVARWPAAQVELLFNAMALGGILMLRSRKLFPAQHFHIYLVAYGLFRFAHEFYRNTPRWGGVLSGYQVIAVVLTLFGVTRFVQRTRDVRRGIASSANIGPGQAGVDTIKIREA